MSNVIIGGGITGMYLALKLQQKYPNYPLTIIEKTSRLGGRINTYEKQKNKYDIGAARYSANHSLLKSLINELKLNGLVYSNKTKKHYYVDNTLIKSEKSLLKHYNVNKYDNIEELWSYIFKKIKTYSDNYLVKKTVNEILHEILTKNEVKVVIQSFLYNTKIFNSDALTTFKSIQENYGLLDKRMFGIDGGTEIIIDKLRDIVIKNGAKILLQHDVGAINKTCIAVSNKGNSYSIKYKELFLCVTRFDLLNFKNLYDGSDKKVIANSLNTGSLMRIYAKYKPRNGKSWFSGIPKILTDNELQFMIPIDPKTGLIMVSYSSDKLADYWNKLGDKKIVEDKIHDILDDMFPKINIPKPDWITIHYWSKGIHYWNPGYNSKKVDKVLHKFDNIHVLGEAFSNHQSWMEGGLQMVDDLLKNPISLTTTKLTKTLLKKEGSRKTADVELPVITKNELKKHTTKESLWAYITDPHTGLDYVYDFTDWIDKHPGGASHIISIGGKDATKKFYGQKAHPIEKIEKVIFPKYRIGILE